MIDIALILLLGGLVLGGTTLASEYPAPDVIVVAGLMITVGAAIFIIDPLLRATT